MKLVEHLVRINMEVREDFQRFMETRCDFDLSEAKTVVLQWPASRNTPELIVNGVQAFGIFSRDVPRDREFVRDVVFRWILQKTPEACHTVQTQFGFHLEITSFRVDLYRPSIDPENGV